MTAVTLQLWEISTPPPLKYEILNTCLKPAYFNHKTYNSLIMF